MPTEISDEQIAFYEQFGQMLTENFDWSTAPQTMQDDYTTYQQQTEALKNNAAPQQDTSGGPTG
jgi:hypothetical protein